MLGGTFQQERASPYLERGACDLLSLLAGAVGPEAGHHQAPKHGSSERDVVVASAFAADPCPADGRGAPEARPHDGEVACGRVHLTEGAPRPLVAFHLQVSLHPAVPELGSHAPVLRVHAY
eukprot:10359144-Heterocapsa_arctica.AAC.1